MAVLKIARMGHPVLQKRAEFVDDCTAPEIRRLVADMIETMEDAGGVGLAAPQVHVSLRLFVYRIPAGRMGHSQSPPIGPAVLFNPALEPQGQQTDLDWEGCLSIPGLRAAVPRFRQVYLRAQDREGQDIEGVVEGYQARVIQHEYDHLDGILYPSRVDDFRLFGFDEELVRAGARLQVVQA
jgi:peptide deformylase